MPGLIAGLFPLLLVLGCSSPATGSSDRSQEEFGPVISEEPGEIVSVRDVVITPASAGSRGAPATGTRMGTAAVAGAITRSPVPLVRSVSSVMTDAGRGKLDNHMGEEITVRLKGSRVVRVVQDRSTPPMSPGEPVLVVTSGFPGSPEKIRVIREVEDPSAPIGARRD